MPVPPTLSDLRAQLDAAFDDVQLDAFCLSHFPEVYDQFGRGLRRDEKVTLLLNYCRTKGYLEHLAQSLTAARQPMPVPAPLDATHLAAYLAALREQCARLETRPYKQLSELRGAPVCLMLLDTYEPLRFDLHSIRARSQRQGKRLARTDDAELQVEALREGSQLDVDLPAVFAEGGHVALLGKAGCGKTTVLRLATAALATGDPVLAEQHLGLMAEPLPVPVLIALREFEHACQTQSTRYVRDVAGLLRFVDDQFQRRNPDRVPENFVSD
ncbi:MAG: hypothetical protein RBT75_20630, partial [Anaerolineae bacterium]|nr:hypothetical protein [Anaerolineae bacterium]